MYAPNNPQTTRRGRPAVLPKLALLLVVLLLAAVGGIAVAQDDAPFSEDVVTATTTRNLNLRNAPGLEGDILATLPFGATVGFTGLTDETGEWVQVDAADGPVGWVWAAFLSNVPDGLTDWMAAAVPAGDADPFSEDVVTATTNANLRVRSMPSLEGDVLTVLPLGTVVGFTGLTDAASEWVQVDAADGPVGWVWAALLSNIPDGLTDWMADDTAAVAPVVDENPFSEDVVTATTNANLRVRNAPNLEGEVLTVLPLGTVVGFTGLTDATGEWVQVDAAGGPVGWVWAALLSNVPDELTVWTAN